MKIKRQTKKSNNGKKAFLVILICVLLVGAYFGVAAAAKLWPFMPATTSQDTPATSTGLNQSETPSKDDTSTSDPGKTTDEVPVSQSIAASIIQLEQKNGIVYFTGTVTPVQSGGTCSITLSNPNDKPIVRTTDATTDGSNSVCGPIQIPETEFSYLGTWTATFRYFIGDVQATATKEITIR